MISKPSLFFFIQFDIPNVFTEVFLIVGAFIGGNDVGITKGRKVGPAVGVNRIMESLVASGIGVVSCAKV